MNEMTAVDSPVKGARRRTVSAPAAAEVVRRSVLIVGAVLGLTLLSWWRLPEKTRDTVWAEDAAVFLRETMTLGTFSSVPTPYSGYLHVLPRVISGIAYQVAPIDFYGSMMSFLTCAAVAGISVAVFFLSKSLVSKRSVRVMLALIPVLLPVGPIEVLGNAANLHWYLLWLAPWLIIFEPRTWLAKTAMFTFALATATSEIITGVFVPLAVWAMYRRKNYWASAGLILGVVLQVLVTVTRPRYTESAPEGTSVELLSIFYGFVLQAIGSLWESDRRTLAANIVDFGGVALALPTALIVLALAYILAYGSTKWKFTAVYAFGTAVACWTAAIVVNAQPAFNYAAFTVDDWLGQFYFFRYAAAPSMFLLVLFPVAAAVAADRNAEKNGRVGYAGPIAMFLFLMMNYFPADTTRQVGPEWQLGVAAARAACSADPQLTAASVHAAPSGWRIEIPCPVLLKP